MPFVNLNLVSQNIQLVRNMSRIIQFEGQDENGNPADFSDTVDSRLRITHHYGVDASSEIITYTDLIPNGTRVQRTWSTADVADLPLGSFLYEMQVAWAAGVWFTSHQGEIGIAPSTFTLNEA